MHIFTFDFTEFSFLQYFTFPLAVRAKFLNTLSFSLLERFDFLQSVQIFATSKLKSEAVSVSDCLEAFLCSFQNCKVTRM
jgi:hypothetical protein